MNATRSALDIHLVDGGLDERAAADARFLMHRRGVSFGEALLRLGVMNEEQLAAALAALHHVPAWDGRVDETAARQLTATFCRQFRVLPAARERRRLVLATADPSWAIDLEAVRFATKTDEIEIVVGADRAIRRAYQFAFSDSADLARRAATHVGDVGDGWEEGLRRRWQAADDSESDSESESERRLDVVIAERLLLSIVDGEYSAVRFEIGDQATILVRTDRGWVNASLATVISCSSLLARDVAARIAHMAGLDSVFAVGDPSFTLLCGARAGTVEFDVSSVVALPGHVLLVTTARIRDHDMPPDENESWETLRRAEEACDELRFAEAHEALIGVAALVSGRESGNRLEAIVSRLRAHVLFCEGRLAEARALRVRALSCTDDHPIWRCAAFLDLANDAFYLADAADAERWAREALAYAESMFGLGTELAHAAIYYIGIAQIEQGAFDAAASTADDVERSAAVHGPGARFRASRLRGLTLLHSGEAVAALHLFDDAIARDVASPDQDTIVQGQLHGDAARAQLQLGEPDEAWARLARARDCLAKSWAPNHPELLAIERQADTLRPKHPYR